LEINQGYTTMHGQPIIKSYSSRPQHTRTDNKFTSMPTHVFFLTPHDNCSNS